MTGRQTARDVVCKDVAADYRVQLDCLGVDFFREAWARFNVIPRFDSDQSLIMVQRDHRYAAPGGYGND